MSQVLFLQYCRQKPRYQPAGTCPPELVSALGANDLEVANNTVTDGNCGLHAFALSLLDVGKRTHGIRTTHAFKKIVSLQKNVPALLTHLRGLATKWMVDHGDLDLWDGMTYSAMALHMSSVSGESYSEYVKRMSVDKTWADVSLIHALACVFDVDVSIWQAQQEPALVGASLHEDGSRCLLAIALVNDYHFWGVIKSNEEALVATDNGDWLNPALLSGVSADRHRKAGHGDDDGEGPEQGVFEMPMLGSSQQCMSEAEITAELALCQCLREWNPWSEPSETLVAAVRDLSSVSRNMSDGKSCVLRSQVVADLAWEEVHATTLPERMKYHAAARYRLRGNRVMPQGRSAKRHESVMELLESQVLLDMDALQEMLQQPCEKHATKHACMDRFRANPNLVRNWRVLWKSLPAPMRREALIELVSRSLHGAQNSKVLVMPQVTYSFLGVHVCASAFHLLTGIGHKSITKAKEAALAGKKSSLSRSELSWSLQIAATSKPKLYIDARVWLENYAATHAEESPMKSECYLPAGRKLMYYLVYAYERKAAGQQHAAFQTFLEAWRHETPWLAICSRNSQFVDCASTSGGKLT